MDEISDEQLISMAKEAAKKAYVPYSHFHVAVSYTHLTLPTRTGV